MGDVYHIQAGDTLADIARRHDLGYVELLAANPGVDPWVPPEGVPLILPTTHIAPSRISGLVVDLAGMRLYFAPHKDGPVENFPIGIGREADMLTPGTTRVAGKRVRPTWVPPPSIRKERPDLPAAVPPGPDNPLGEYSLDLAQGTIRIHGTNQPDGVGRRSSHGCLRLYPEDIARLFPKVAVGTPVTVVDEPARLAWIEGELWLEVYPVEDQADAVEDRRPAPPRPMPGLAQRVADAAGPLVDRVDWSMVAWAEAHHPGVPVRVAASPAAPPPSSTHGPAITFGERP